MNIPRTYVVDENNERIAVQLDLATFEKILDLLEDRGLADHMICAEESESLSIEDARTFYAAEKNR
jgi:hypothetical protein